MPLNTTSLMPLHHRNSFLLHIWSRIFLLLPSELERILFLQKQIDMPWDNIDEFKYMFGEYEGVWFVDQQEVDTAKLTVTNESFQVRYPLGYVVNKYFGKENV